MLLASLDAEEADKSKNSRTAIEGGRTRLAILTICAGVAFLASNDAIAKLLVERYDPIQVVFFRNLIALPMMGAVVLYLHGWSGFQTAHVYGALSRAFLATMRAIWVR